jgi:hypothetical protein
VTPRHGWSISGYIGPDREELLLLEGRDSTVPVPERVYELVLRVVTPADLAAQSVWIANWQRMLPVINVTRTLLPKGLRDSVLHLVREPVALSRVEHELAMGDPSLVRGAVFDLLRTGRLCAPGLRTHALSLHTLLEPAP